jgi:hypothetical protein
VIAREMAKPSPRGQHAQYQPRKEQGQFAGPPKFPTPEVPGPLPTSAPAVRPAMPPNLKPELSAHWETAHPDLLSAFVQRDADYNRGMAEVFKPAKKQLEEILNEFKPYEAMMRAEGATPRTAIGPLLQTAAILRTGSAANKATAVAQMMRQFGIPLEHIQQVLSGNAPLQPALDPQFSQLAQQVNQLTAYQQQQNEARAMSAIKRFAANPEHKHFDAVSERILGFLEYPAALGLEESATEEEKLEAAYDAACRLDPAVSAQIASDKQAKELAGRQAQAAAEVTQARQAAVQVKGAPSAGPPPPVNPKDRRAFIANQLNGTR